MARILITGSTGMVGKGVLLEAIQDSNIDSIVLLNRSAIGMDHPKIEEVLLKDFSQVESVKTQIGLIDACFHCMGVSALGMTEEDYSRLTYDISTKLADVCYTINPAMTFIYVSGTGTDSSEKGSTMWARVKGKTENYILAKGFAKATMFRPGVIIPENGIRSRTKLYNVFFVLLSPIFPFLKKMSGVTTTTKIGKAMIVCMNKAQGRKVHLSNVDINALAV